MSSTTAWVPVVAAARRHTLARTSAIASHSPDNVSGLIERKVRYSVESDATEPNNAAWARRRSMSAHASPPPVSINMAWTSTLPRSCSGRRSPVTGMRADRQSPRPRRSAKAPRACSPTWATTPLPDPSTSAESVLLRFTW